MLKALYTLLHWPCTKWWLPFPLEVDGRRLKPQPTEASPLVAHGDTALSSSMWFDQCIFRGEFLGLSPPRVHNLDDAVSCAFERDQLLVVLAHSELNPESQRLVHGIVSDDPLKNTLSSRVVFFPISALDPQVQQVAALQDASFPCVLVFVPVGGPSGVSLLAKMEGGIITPRAMLDVVKAALSKSAR